MTSHNKYLTSNHVIFAFLVALGAFYGIEIATTNAWHDESITMLELAGRGSGGWPQGAQSLATMREVFQGVATPREITQVLTTTDVHPPLYYWVLTVPFLIFGSSVEVARVVSLLCALGAAALILDMVRKLAPRGMLLAYALLAISPTLLFSATNARGYGLALLLVAACLWILAEQTSRSASGRSMSTTWLAAAAVAGGLAYATHYFAIFAVASAWAALLLQNSPKHRKKVAIATIALIALVAMTLPLMIGQAGDRPNQYAGALPVWAEIGLALYSVFSQFVYVGLISSPSRMVFCLGGAIMVGAAAWATHRARGTSPEMLLLLCLVGSTMVLLGTFLSTNKSLLLNGTRYSVFILPAAVVLLSSWVHRAIPVRDDEHLSDRGLLGSLSPLLLLVVVGTLSHATFPKINGNELSDFADREKALVSVEPTQAGVVFVDDLRGVVAPFLVNTEVEAGAFVITTADQGPALEAFLEGRDVVALVMSISAGKDLREAVRTAFEGYQASKEVQGIYRK